jgi:hypothetical protein
MVAVGAKNASENAYEPRENLPNTLGPRILCRLGGQQSSSNASESTNALLTLYDTRLAFLPPPGPQQPLWKPALRPRCCAGLW